MVRSSILENGNINLAQPVSNPRENLLTNLGSLSAAIKLDQARNRIKAMFKSSQGCGYERGGSHASLATKPQWASTNSSC